MVTIFTKPHCPLCDKALEEVERAAKQVRFEMREVNILSDPNLYERYKHEIPVISIDGGEAFRYRVTAEELIAALEKRRGDS